MKILTAASTVLLCLVVSEARSFDPESSDAHIADFPIEPEARRPRYRSGRRHRKRSYGYLNPFSTERQDYVRNQEYLLPEILRVLDEISVSLKRAPAPPPAPHQPIYIPYPVIYTVPQKCQDESVPTIGSRVKMEDVRQNWGLDVKPLDIDEEDDGSRPISLVPIRPQRPTARPVPKVEHGSFQAGESQTTRLPFLSAASTLAPASVRGNCNAAVLFCCGNKDNNLQKRCLSDLNCESESLKANVCSKDSYALALESLKMLYSPS